MFDDTRSAPTACGPGGDEEKPGSGWAISPRALAIGCGCLVVAVSIVTALVGQRPAARTSEPAYPRVSLRATTSPSTSTEVEPAPTAASDDDEDAAYLSALRASGILVVDPNTAVAAGRAVCAYLKQGHSQADVVAVAMHFNPMLSPIDAFNAVTAAVLAYCPEINRR